MTSDHVTGDHRPTGEIPLTDRALTASAQDQLELADATLTTDRSSKVTATRSDESDRSSPVERETVVVPVMREFLSVGKRWVEGEKVVVRIEPQEQQEVIDLPLAQEEVGVERVPRNEFVSTRTDVRQEGDTTIIPVFEEVLVVEKRLLLREEIRLTRRTIQRTEQQTVTLRSEAVHIDRIAAQPHQAAGQPERVEPEAR